MTTEKRQYIFLALIILIVLLLGAIVYHKPDSHKDAQVSILDMGPTAPEASIAPTEPVVLAWKPYENNQYNFALSIPAEWQERDFEKSFPGGGTLVAFSPNPLPCETCTYIHDGYFSVRVYDKKTDPERYADFQKRMASIGKIAGYQQLHLDNDQGVYFANLAAVEHHEWVYEVSLDINDGSQTFEDSKIFQKTLSSFRFTDLAFTN